MRSGFYQKEYEMATKLIPVPRVAKTHPFRKKVLIAARYDVLALPCQVFREGCIQKEAEQNSSNQPKNYFIFGKTGNVALKIKCKKP